MKLVPHQQLGPYRLLHPLDLGGHGQIWLADHAIPQEYTALSPYVALKVPIALSREAVPTRMTLARFAEEARMHVQLTHRHIVHLHSYSVIEHIPVIVMDYVPNGSLRHFFPNDIRLPLETVVDYVKQVAAGLHYMHKMHIVHQDIKLENILMGSYNRLLICDFGLAVNLWEIRFGKLRSKCGGTVEYTSPEQSMCRPCPASDQYSLAILAYELLAGGCPFQGTPDEIRWQHRSAPVPSLHDQFSAIPHAVDRVLARALAKDPQHRFWSVLEFAHALEEAGGFPPTKPPGPSVRSTGALSPRAHAVRRPASPLAMHPSLQRGRVRVLVPVQERKRRPEPVTAPSIRRRFPTSLEDPDSHMGYFRP